MPDQDLASAWMGFDEGRRKGLLARMSPEQKQNLRKTIESRGTPTPAAPVSTPAEGKGMFQTMRDNLQQFQSTPQMQAAAQPHMPLEAGIERVVGALPGFAKQVAGDAWQSVKEGDPHALMDDFDPAKQAQGVTDQFKQDWSQGKVQAVDNLLGTAAGTALVGAATHGATEVVKGAKGAVKSGTGKALRTTARSVLDADDDFTQKQVKAYGEKADAHAQKTTAARQDTASSDRILRRHAELDEAIPRESAELDRRISQAKVNGEASRDAKYDQVRQGIGDNRKATQNIQERVQRLRKNNPDLEKDPLLGQIFRGTTETEYVFDKSGMPVGPEDEGYDKLYEGENGGESAPMGSGDQKFDRLKSWYGRLGREMYKPSIDPTVKRAYGQVRDAIGKNMHELAEEHGQGDTLNQAMKEHHDLLETFSDNPNERASHSKSFQQSTMPDYLKERDYQDRADMHARYDPEIKAKAKNIRAMREEQQALPSRESAQNMAKPQPVAPETPDITAERRAQMHVKLKKYTQVGAWVLRLGLGGAATALLSHGGEGVSHFVSQLGVGEGGIQVLARALNRPSVLDWMSEPTAADYAAIDSLPPDQAASLRSKLTDLADVDRKTGTKAAPIAPKLAAWLAVGGAAQPPQNRKEAMAALGR